MKKSFFLKKINCFVVFGCSKMEHPLDFFDYRMVDGKQKRGNTSEGDKRSTLPGKRF